MRIQKLISKINVFNKYYSYKKYLTKLQ